MFYAIFFDEFAKGELEIKEQKGGLHTTLAHNPTEATKILLDKYIGTKVTVELIGYENNGKNEGIEVAIPDDIPFFGNKPHITLSYAKNSKAVDTGFLKFSKSKFKKYQKTYNIPNIITGIIKKYE